MTKASAPVPIKKPVNIRIIIDQKLHYELRKDALELGLSLRALTQQILEQYAYAKPVRTNPSK